MYKGTVESGDEKAIIVEMGSPAQGVKNGATIYVVTDLDELAANLAAPLRNSYQGGMMFGSLTQRVRAILDDCVLGQKAEVKA